MIKYKIIKKLLNNSKNIFLRLVEEKNQNLKTQKIGLISKKFRLKIYTKRKFVLLNQFHWINSELNLFYLCVIKMWSNPCFIHLSLHNSPRFDCNLIF